MDNQNLKTLLNRQSSVGMSDELFERFVGYMTEIRLKNKEVLIPYGEIDTDLYVQKDGLLRACYMDGENEKTYGFSDAGTVVISYSSHFMHQPSVFQIESCGETRVLKMSKKDLDDMVDKSLEFAKWMLSTQMGQLHTNELKLTVVTGSAKERYRFMIHNRPEILARVPVKTIASYLGVAPNYLSYLKRVLHKEK